MSCRTTWAFFTVYVAKRQLTLVYDFCTVPPVPDYPEVPDLKDEVEKAMERCNLAGASALAAATGLTVQGLAPLLRGDRRRYQKRLTWPVCDAFGWTRDSIGRILDGDKPVLRPTMPDATGSQGDAWARVAELEVENAALREQLAARRLRGEALDAEIARLTALRSPKRRRSSR